MIALEEDSFPGKHDMLVACCDPWLYKHYERTRADGVMGSNTSLFLTLPNRVPKASALPGSSAEAAIPLPAKASR